jgi:hypothetical protein
MFVSVTRLPQDYVVRLYAFFGGFLVGEEWEKGG